MSLTIFVGFVVLGIAAVTFVLPIVSFLRISRVASELRALQARLASLEAEVRGYGRPEGLPHAGAGDRQPEGLAQAEPGDRRPEGLPQAEPDGRRSEGLPLAEPDERRPEGLARAEPDDPRPESLPADPPHGRLENAIGERLILWAGIVVFVLGIGFFVKYAFDRAWITEEMRVALGALAGLALMTGGLRLARAGYDTYGNMLAGGGIAALYLSTYAALGFYDLIGRGTATVLFMAITAGAAALADRQRSQGMAILAVGGGFVTPFLVGSGRDAQITLFSYVALLIAGTMALAHRRDWPLLNLVSYALTLLTLIAWGDVYYTPAKYLRTELFLTLYCGMFLVVLWQTTRSTSALKDLAVIVLATAPILYHFTSLAILWPHDVALPIYVILFALTGTVWSVRTGSSYRRLVIWLAAFLPFLVWADDHQARSLLLPSLTTLAALFALPVIALIDRIVRRDEPLDGWDVLLLHLNAIGAFFGAWIVLSDHAIVWVPRLGILLALAHGVLARWLHARLNAGALHALAATFALIAAAVAVELDGRWLTAAYAIEGAAVLGIGVRVRRDWFRLGGALLLAIAAARWLMLSVPETPVTFTLVLNETFALGALIVGLLYLLAWAHARSRAEDGEYDRSIAWLLVSASALTVVLLTAQNASYWQIRGATLPDATFAGQLALSLLWTFYGAALIVAGVRRAYAPIRYAGMTLIGVTILKVFLVDLSGLQGIYRVFGLLVVGAVLLAISFLYQRARAR